MIGSNLAIAEFRDGPRRGVVAALVACSGCGVLFTLRPRTMRDLRQQRRLPACETCRRPAKIEVTVELLEWWLEWAGVPVTQMRLRGEWPGVVAYATGRALPLVVDLAEATFGPRSSWQPHGIRVVLRPQLAEAA